MRATSSVAFGETHEPDVLQCDMELQLYKWINYKLCQSPWIKGTVKAN